MQSFNVAGQGPFPVTIEDFSSRNGLPPLSNVHLLSVTDLLQWKNCCCYKREDQLKKRYTTMYNQNSEPLPKVITSAHNCQLCEDSECPQAQVQESYKPSFQSCSSCSLQRLNSPEALCLLSASESHLREQPSFYCVVFSLFSLSPCILYFYSFGLTSFLLYSLFHRCCSFSGTQAQSLVKRLGW